MPSEPSRIVVNEQALSPKARSMTDIVVSARMSIDEWLMIAAVP
jgi:hypothetical protein